MVCARVFFVLVRGKRRSSILFMNIITVVAISRRTTLWSSLVLHRSLSPGVDLGRSLRDTVVGSHARTHTFLSPRHSRRLPTVARPSDGLAVMARRTNIVTTHLFVGPVSGGRKLTGVYPLPPRRNKPAVTSVFTRYVLHT